MRAGLRPLALAMAMIVFLQGGDHVGAQHAHQHRPFGEAERQRRQHEAAQVAERILARTARSRSPAAS